VLWGTGTPRREFLYSDDDADACVFLMNLLDETFRSVLGPESSVPNASPPLINIGCGQDQTIRELAEVTQEVVGFDGEMQWDHTKPDGTPRKLLDVSKLGAFGWRPKVVLKDGVRSAYKEYLTRS
jgi:GDP-L-fucose synthase